MKPVHHVVYRRVPSGNRIHLLRYYRRMSSGVEDGRWRRRWRESIIMLRTEIGLHPLLRVELMGWRARKHEE